MLQLPVPEATARENTGLTPLGAASLVLHARATGAASGHELLVLPGPALRRFGDARLLHELAGLAPDVVALTVTVWNVERSLHLARRLREALPGVALWLGGPEIAADAPLLTRPGVRFDVAVEGEGEAAFAALLSGARPDALPGVRSLPGGLFLGANAFPWLPDLGTLHDPYVAGLVSPEADGAMLAELWRGCRYTCTFCRYAGGRHHAGASRPLEQVRQLFAWARDAGVRELYLLDPSLEQRPDLLDFLASLAASNRPDPIPLFVELRAEAIDADLAARLADAGVRWVEAGLQTVTPEALRLTGRSLDRAAFVAGLGELRRAGIRSKIDVMLGLPGDSAEGLRQTLGFLVDHGFADHLQLFRTKVLPGTALRRSAKRLGLVYESEPPYSVLATPSWPADELAAAVQQAEDVLDRDLGGVEVPVLERPSWGRRTFVEIPYPDADATFEAAARLDAREGRAGLAATTFERAGNAFGLWLEADDLLPHGDAITGAITRFVAANPFATLTVALVGLPEGPLDPFLAAHEALERGRVSRYLERLHESPRPERRLVAVLEAPWRGHVDPGWLEALRGVASVLWMTRTDLIEGSLDALRAVDDLDPRDALLVAPREWPEEPAELERVMAEALAACPEPERVTWSPLTLQWSWVRAVERAGDSGW